MKPVESALRLRGLTKRFDRLAVDALDLDIRIGEFYALLGPNGAGKTTTLRMVAGLLKPDAGEVTVLGIDALVNGSDRPYADPPQLDLSPAALHAIRSANAMRLLYPKEVFDDLAIASPA